MRYSFKLTIGAMALVCAALLTGCSSSGGSPALSGSNSVDHVHANKHFSGGRTEFSYHPDSTPDSKDKIFEGIGGKNKKK